MAFQGQPAQSILLRNLDFILKVRKCPEELLSKGVKWLNINEERSWGYCIKKEPRNPFGKCCFDVDNGPNLHQVLLLGIRLERSKGPVEGIF